MLTVDHDRALFVDPLVPGDEETFWRCDDTVGSRPVHVLTTIRFHDRSREAVAARYGGEVITSLRILVTHGQPLLSGGAAALERILA